MALTLYKPRPDGDLATNINGLSGGDVAMLTTGDYGVIYIAASGSAGNPVIVCVAPGANVRCNRLIVQNSNHCLIDGSGGLFRMETYIDGTSRFFPMVDQSVGDNNILRNLHIMSLQPDAMMDKIAVRDGAVFKGDNNVIEDCVIEATGIAINMEGAGNKSRRNHIRKHTKQGILIGEDSCIASFNVVVECDPAGDRTDYPAVQTYDQDNAATPNSQHTYNHVIYNNRLVQDVAGGQGIMQTTGKTTHAQVVGNLVRVGTEFGINFDNPYDCLFADNWVLPDLVNTQVSKLRLAMGTFVAANNRALNNKVSSLRFGGKSVSGMRNELVPNSVAALVGNSCKTEKAEDTTLFIIPQVHIILENKYKAGSRNNNGIWVRQMQGVIGATMDGDFGNGTEVAVKAWQTSKGLSADGVVGVNTLAAMGLPKAISYSDMAVYAMLDLWGYTASKLEKMVAMLREVDAHKSIYKLDTPLRWAHFVAQIRQESGPSLSMSENLNYSCNSLKAIFSYFKNNPASANKYGRCNGHAANQPAIANRAYANRVGNGSISSGDGWAFRGRGPIQLTGRTNYTAFNNWSKANFPEDSPNFVTNPNLVEQPNYAIRAAIYYWTQNNIHLKADKGTSRATVDSITKAINGPAMHGADERYAFFLNMKKLLWL